MWKVEKKITLETSSVAELVKCGNYIASSCHTASKAEKKKTATELLNICALRWTIEEVRLWTDRTHIGYNMIQRD